MKRSFHGIPVLVNIEVQKKKCTSRERPTCSHSCFHVFNCYSTPFLEFMQVKVFILDLVAKIEWPPRKKEKLFIPSYENNGVGVSENGLFS